VHRRANPALLQVAIEFHTVDQIEFAIDKAVDEHLDLTAAHARGTKSIILRLLAFVTKDRFGRARLNDDEQSVLLKCRA
jgi:hypothetical protein